MSRKCELWGDPDYGKSTLSWECVYMLRMSNYYITVISSKFIKNVTIPKYYLQLFYKLYDEEM